MNHQLLCFKQAQYWEITFDTVPKLAMVVKIGKAPFVIVKQETVKNSRYSFFKNGIAMFTSSDWPITTRFVISDLLAAKI